MCVLCEEGEGGGYHASEDVDMRDHVDIKTALLHECWQYITEIGDR